MRPLNHAACFANTQSHLFDAASTSIYERMPKPMFQWYKTEAMVGDVL
jgi:hypothetical protein